MTHPTTSTSSTTAAAGQAGVAIITGASRGIGADIARRLAHDGYAVVVNYASRSTDADALVASLAADGHRAIAVKADVAQSADVQRLFDEAESQLGKVDVLVNNAGILTTMPLAQTSDELYESTFGVNVRGTFNTLREAGKRLNDGGRIVNFSSTTLALNLPGYAIYNGTKAAVEAFTRVFAKELRGRQIRVNVVAPGPVATDLFLNGKTEEQVQQFAKMPPLERLGQTDDIAKVVAFLVSQESGWVNGQVLRANGGLA
ncbi:SDR family oxidoreductase [Pigmentiphaga litoralis]|uniref:3-oxoacyl-[acyl-carrier protein] reductase n=1 Tax=Pigmentiphaga litoralis TaxID=516702 RepID=A0A7Y9ISI6_9BURK|nr:SDR family oxidoreductase [Pigmentiphaga litoralis]NYE24356.1 3-oxoacyl-[acyl-carrier protein] reductase [Pigmentiphaga litoralis]NYE82030.1 3-oxoacyl-[acyl-carrier protein] reductase [Pigmentiphaga litoralis]